MFWAWSEGMEASGLSESLSLTSKKFIVFREEHLEGIYLILDPLFCSQL